MNNLIKLLTIAFMAMAIFAALLLIASLIPEPEMEVHYENNCPIPTHVHSEYNITVICQGCCEDTTKTPEPTRYIASTPTTRLESPTWTPTGSPYPSLTPHATITRTVQPTPTRPVDTATKTTTPTLVSTPTVTPTVGTATGTVPVTETVASPTATSTPSNTETPRATELTCYQWVCHRTGASGWKDYCCDNQGCVDAHLKHGDHLGKCNND